MTPKKCGGASLIFFNPPLMTVRTKKQIQVIFASVIYLLNTQSIFIETAFNSLKTKLCKKQSPGHKREPGLLNIP